MNSNKIKTLFFLNGRQNGEADTGTAYGLNPADCKERELKRKPDGNLYLRATKLHELADPVKALLGPYNTTAAQVDALAVKKKNFF